jgi:hypothetical protein
MNAWNASSIQKGLHNLYPLHPWDGLWRDREDDAVSRVPAASSRVPLPSVLEPSEKTVPLITGQEEEIEKIVPQSWTLIRSMIDCLYNITAILKDPKENGSWLRKSGFRRAVELIPGIDSRSSWEDTWSATLEESCLAHPPILIDHSVSGLSTRDGN